MADYNTADDTYNSGVNTGNNALNSFNPTDVANTQKSGFNDLYGQQTGTIGDLTKTYASQIADNPSATELYNRGNSIYNVNNLQKQANYLNNQVTNAYPSAVNQARGFDYSQGQVDNAVNQNLRFLEPQATAATNNASQAANLAAQYVTQGMAQNNLNLLPIQSQISATNDAMARLSSGYTTAAQNEMEGLQAKLNAGITLSANEIARANQLAQLAEAYQATLNTNQTTLANTIQGQKYVNVAPGNTLVNTVAQGYVQPATGKVGTY